MLNKRLLNFKYPLMIILGSSFVSWYALFFSRKNRHDKNFYLGKNSNLRPKKNHLKNIWHKLINFLFQYINQLQFSNYQLLKSYQLCKIGCKKRISECAKKISERFCSSTRNQQATSHFADKSDELLESSRASLPFSLWSHESFRNPAGL